MRYRSSTLLKIITSITLISVFAACSPNNVTIDNSLKPIFDSSKVIGSFAMFDNGTGQFTIYNLNRYKDTGFLPASTFKIVNSLIGIETGKVVNEKMVIKWDGKVRTFPNGDTAKNWNKDLTMAEAFEYSAVPYYQEVARRIGKDTMQQYLDSMHYGTAKIKTAIDTFWLDNSLKITADEQLGIVKKLYFYQLGFQRRSQEIVRKMMIRENNTNYTLAYKTGLGTTEKGTQLGWVVGWVEENHHPYFFVLNIEGAKEIPMTNLRVDMLKRILKGYGFFEGKK
ncbi:penicillin-binding transpeptidase domain-containing protein [Parasediminibacterium paludis]|uniref:Beta-lactamase n=1 Tax=Parasediminibacterium paludis TaxID=908966 RepID=A0ABV8Q1E6_9BACT